MKSFLLFTFLVSSGLSAAELRFNCKNSLYNSEYGMKVLESNALLTATLTGTGFSGPQEVEFDTFSKDDSMLVSGVSHIVSKLKFTKNQWAKVSSAEVFTVGNFEDDLAGVRGVNFLDQKNKIVKSGMFFGWAGPSSCLK